MKTTSSNIPVQTITNQINRGEIVLKHKLQRREGVWSRAQKSLLIDSFLRGYLCNPTYTVLEDNQQKAIDGVQRLGTVRDFVNDEFALTDLEPVEINGTIYEISDKKFSELDEICRDKILSAQMQVYEISNYTDKEVREMFARINSGKPLNTIQKMTPNMSDELSNVIFDIVSHPFFEKVFTPAQLKNSVDMTTALELLMLCEQNKDYDFGSFSKKDKEKFIEYYNEHINDEKIFTIIRGLDALNDVYENEETISIPKTSLSFICYAYYRVVKDNKDLGKLTDAVKYFLDNYDSNDIYKGYVAHGTNSKESVKGRFEYWRSIIREL